MNPFPQKKQFFKHGGDVGLCFVCEQLFFNIISYSWHLAAPSKTLLLRIAEGHYGHFEEKYRLPIEQFNLDNVQASVKNGVLEVVIPKRRVTPGRRMNAFNDMFWPSSNFDSFF